MSEERFERLVREAAQSYNAPPPTPREQIWARIEGARAADELRQRRLERRRRQTQWLAAAAAVLVVGIGIGRYLPRPGDGPPVVVQAGPAASGTPQRVAATHHLTRAEALLTTVRREADAGSLDEQTVVWARELLSTTRLLLDSRAAQDSELRILLEDLELVLAQIVQLPGQSAPAPEAGQELDLVRDAIEGGTVLPRLRNAIPDGTPVSTL